MRRRNHISTALVKEQFNKKNKLPQDYLEDNFKSINYNYLKPAFSFEYVQERFCLSKWDNKRIKRLIEELGKLENFTWQEILTQSINHFKVVDKQGLKVDIPRFITPDVKIHYMKPFGTNTPYRVFGIRDGHNFKFLWFDDKHEIYP